MQKSDGGGRGGVELIFMSPAEGAENAEKTSKRKEEREMKTLEFIKEMRERMSKDGVPVISQTVDGPFFIEKDFATIRDNIVDEQYQRICNAFGLTKSKQLREMFRDVTCGRGNEWVEINQLNSSALLCFLCFNGVAVNGISIDNQRYNAVRFEVKSNLEPCGRSRPISNMDVVLLNTEEKKALFLESKFTEYLNQSTQLEVGSYYGGKGGRYNGLFTLGNACKVQVGDNVYYGNGFWRVKKEKEYLEGVKQMICHYMGITDQLRVLESETWKSKDWDAEGLKNYKEIKLGEIVFRFDGYESAFNQYKGTYSGLKTVLDGLNDRVTLLPELLSYQDVFGSKNANLIDKKTRKFYGL